MNEMCSRLENQDAVSAAHAMSNFGGEAFVVHQKDIDFSDVVDEEFFQSIGQ